MPIHHGGYIEQIEEEGNHTQFVESDNRKVGTYERMKTLIFWR